MRIWMILTFSNPPSLFNCYFPSSSLFLVCLSLLSLPSFSLSILSLLSSSLLSSPFSFLSLPPLFLYAFPLHSPPPFSLPFPPSSISCMPFLHFLYLPSLLSSPFPFSSPAASPLLPPSLPCLSCFPSIFLLILLLRSPLFFFMPFLSFPSLSSSSYYYPIICVIIHRLSTLFSFPFLLK